MRFDGASKGFNHLDLLLILQLVIERFRVQIPRQLLSIESVVYFDVFVFSLGEINENVCDPR